LYKNQIAYFNSESLLKKEVEQYESFKSIQEEHFPDLDIDRITLGGLIKLFHITRLFDLIENYLDTRLTFTKQIRWKYVNHIRNKVTHNAYKPTKAQALDFIQIAKVFLHESGLIDYDSAPKESICYSCKSVIDKSWNYCANCGTDLGNYCKKCYTPLKNTWTICPKCKTPRSGVRTKNPEIMYAKYCEAVWADGVLTRDEKLFLDSKRVELGLEIDEADKIEELYAPRNAVRFRDMVEATLIDGIIDENEKIYLRGKAKQLKLSDDMANAIYNACLQEDIRYGLFAKKERKAEEKKTLK
jgi:hypothetical protein